VVNVYSGKYVSSLSCSGLLPSATTLDIETASRIDPQSTAILGIAPFEETEWEGEMSSLPTEFNMPLEEEYILRTEASS